LPGAPRFESPAISSTRASPRNHSAVPSGAPGDLLDETTDGIRAVIDDDQLAARVVLRRPARQRHGRERPAVGGRHDAGDERCRAVGGDEREHAGDGDRRPPGIVRGLRRGVRGMQRRDAQRRVREIAQLGPPARPAEADVLADLGVGERVRLPDAAAIREGVAADERLAAAVRVAPRTRAVVVEIVELARAAYVGARRDRQGLRAEPPRRIPVVVVPVGDHAGGLRLRAGQVALGADRAWRAVEADVADPRIVGDEVAHGVGAVVEDQELARRVGLVQEAPDRPRDERAAIA
jgi:hypothetical protein